MGCCGGHKDFNPGSQHESHEDQGQDGHGQGVGNWIWIVIGAAVVVLYILTR